MLVLAAPLLSLHLDLHRYDMVLEQSCLYFGVECNERVALVELGLLFVKLVDSLLEVQEAVHPDLSRV